MSDAEQDFWTGRLYAAAAVLFLLTSARSVPSPSLAESFGTLLGGVLGALAVVALVKKAYLRYS